jgi:hypothetical protein
MSCQVHSATSASQVYAQSAKQASAPKPQPQHKPDTVLLSKQAQAALDADHDGDSR